MVLPLMVFLSACQKIETPIDANVLTDFSENINVETTLLSIPNTHVSSFEEDTTVFSSNSSTKTYEYSPPQEVLNTHFYIDDVEAEIKLQSALSEDFRRDFEILDIFYDSEVEKELHKAFEQNLPHEIVYDMIQYPQFPEDMENDNIKITSIDYMKYDFNSDGRDDYYVVANLDDKNEVENLMHMRTFYSFRRVYITNESSFIPIKIPNFSDNRNGIHSILSTETNGVKDLLVFCNSNAPSLKYDGISAYGGFTESDERHTFTDSEILSNNTLYLNMQISVIDAPLGEYYTAIKVADNPYIKNNVLYTCYPDGTPRTYTQKPYGKYNDFNPSRDGYDFYVELTDEGAAATNVSLDILEIKYIAVDDDSR